MKRIVIGMVSCILFVSTAACSQETIDSVSKQLMEKWGKIQTITAPFSVEITYKSTRNDYVMRLNGGGAVQFRTKDGVGQFRLDVHAKMPEPSTAEGKAMVLCTGTDMFIDYEFLVFKKSEHIDLKTVPEIPGGKIAPLPYASLMTQFTKFFNVTLVPSTPEAPNSWVFEGVIKEPAKEVPLQTVRVYFNKETGVLMRIHVFSSAQQELVNLTTMDAIINKPIGDEPFVYVPPAPEASATTAVKSTDEKTVDKKTEQHEFNKKK